MPRPSSVLAAATLCLAASALHAPGLVAAQDAAGPSMTISSYRGVAFGAGEAEILKVRGTPLEDRRLESGLRMLAYRDSLAGRPSMVLFGLLDDAGFVKAQEVIDATEGRECIEMIRQIHRGIDVQYPLIRPSEQAKNNSPASICEAAREGQAFWHRQWRDNETGTVILVSLPSGSEQIDVIYESEDFRRWADPATDGQVEVLEDDGAPPEVLDGMP